MHRAVLLASTSIATSLAFLAGAGGARADSCVDLRTSQVYDCSQSPPSAPARGQPAPSQSQLRDTLRKSISAGSTTAATEQPQARWADASSRAMQAMDSAGLTSDPTERAQLMAKYNAAVSDMRAAGNDMLAAAPNLAARAQLSDFLTKSQGWVSQQASQVGISAVQTQPSTIRDQVQSPASSASAGVAPGTSQGNVFSVCDDPKSGVTSCYEMGRTGDQCQEVWYQGGQKTLERGWKTCSAADQQQRDAYFSGQPVGQGAPADPRSQQISGLIASLPQQCQQDLKSYLYGSRDSQTSGKAGASAMSSFSNINGNQECKAGFERLASILGVEIPQRHLGAASRQAWSSGMADKPREVVNVPDVHDMPQGYYGDNTAGGGWDTGQVLNTGAQLLGILGAIVGGFAEGYGSGGGYSSGPVYTSRPSYGYGGPSGGGYVYRGSSSNSQSTITGTHR